MRTRIQIWGNSLAVRIPKAFAVEAGLKSDTVVDISLEDGRLIVAPATTSPFTLDRLLAGISDDNLHGETDTGPAVGKEVW